MAREVASDFLTQVTIMSIIVTIEENTKQLRRDIVTFTFYSYDNDLFHIIASKNALLLQILINEHYESI